MKNHYRSFTAALAALCLAGAVHTHAQEVSSVMIAPDGHTSLFSTLSSGPLLAAEIPEEGSAVLRLAGHGYGGLFFRNNGYGGTAVTARMLAVAPDPGGGDGQSALEFWNSPTGPATWLLCSGVPAIQYVGANGTNGYVPRWRGRFSSDPDSPMPGETYWNTATSKARLWNGTGWVDLN